MGATSERPVVVGVTGAEREVAALRFAEAYARRTGAPVVLVHAYGAALPPPPPSILLSYRAVAEAARDVVRAAGEEFARLTGGTVPFRTLVESGAGAPVLADLSRDARLVVVQHRTSRWLGRLAVGSTASGAAAHALCPVVSVPEGWEERAASGEVVVGVHRDGAPLQAVEQGIVWAGDTAVPLRVLHAWHLDGAYDDIITARVESDWRTEQRQAIEAAIRDLRRSHPGVPVEVEVRHQWPAQALADAAREASLVVVGRHTGGGRLTGHLGSVARTVLREAAGPVMVVPLD